MGPLYFSIVCILLVILFVLKQNGTIGRDILCNKKNLDKNATIISTEPVEKGSKGSSHYEIIINFSDGSHYRTIC